MIDFLSNIRSSIFYPIPRPSVKLCKKVIDELNNVFNIYLIHDKFHQLNLNFKFYAFGGFVRDIALRRKWHDIDLRVVSNLPVEESISKFTSIISTYGKIEEKVFVTSKNNYFLIRFIPGQIANDTHIDFVLTERYDYWNDFTIHAIYVDIISKKLINKYSGIEDLKKKIIRTCISPKIIINVEKGSLHFRTVKIACFTGFNIDNKLQTELKKTVNMIPDYLRILKTMETVHKKLSLSNVFSGLFVDPEKYLHLIVVLGIYRQIIIYITGSLKINLDPYKTVIDSTWFSFKIKNNYIGNIKLFIILLAKSLFPNQSEKKQISLARKIWLLFDLNILDKPF